MLVPSTTQQSG